MLVVYIYQCTFSRKLLRGRGSLSVLSKSLQNFFTVPNTNHSDLYGKESGGGGGGAPVIICVGYFKDVLS